MLRVPEVLHSICNMCSQDLPDMSTLVLGHCVPSDSCIHIRQIHVTCITYQPYLYYELWYELYGFSDDSTETSN